MARFSQNKKKPAGAKPAKGAKAARSPPQADLSERIVDAALDLAEETGWDGLRLRRVGERLGVPLAEPG